MMTEVPREMFQVSIFGIAIYFLIGYDGSFIEYLVTFFLCAYAGGSLGLFVGALIETVEHAAQLVPAVMLPMLLLGDCMVRAPELPPGVRWLQNLDPLYFLLRCFMLIEFSGTVYPKPIRHPEQRKMCETYWELNDTADIFLDRIPLYLNDSNCTLLVEDILEQLSVQDFRKMSFFSLDFEKQIQYLGGRCKQFDGYCQRLQSLGIYEEYASDSA